MAGMELFVADPVMTWAKVSAIPLEGNDPTTWTRQVLTELYKAVPETSEYTPQVMFMKTDKEQGYAIGIIVISNATDSALAATRTGSSAPKRALVPIVIKSNELQPLDILMTGSGRMTPLNAKRLREALFRPETFEMVTSDWGDSSLFNMFYPPGRSDNTFGSGISQGVDGGTAGAVTFIQGPGMKLSGKHFEMLESLIPTALAPDIEKLCSSLEEIGLLKVAEENEVFMAALRLLASVEGTATKTAEDLISTALDTISPDVVQLGYDPGVGSYWVKTASRSAFRVVGPAYMDRGEFLKIAGDEITKKVDTEGTVTVSTVPAMGASAGVDASKWETIEQPGIYKVKTVSGKEMTGWVLPNLLDTDGTRLPMAVFTNGAAAMVQDQIVGARVASGVDLPNAPAKGSGVFYVAGQGGVEATVPVLVMGSEPEEGGAISYVVKTLVGEDSKIRLVPGIETMQSLKGEIVAPRSAKFLPLDDETMTPLVDSLDNLGKTAAAVLEPKISIIGSDGEYTARIENLSKLASVVHGPLATDEAMLLLCLAGVDPVMAQTKLAAADAGERVDFYGVKDVGLALDRVEAARKIAAASSAEVRGLRAFLTKEAAVLPDVMSIDTILSLGFINSENVGMFISRIPYLENALSQICEILLGSRLGLTEIPETATARCARALDATIGGLRALSMRETPEA